MSTSEEIAWAAGFFEGEGCFSSHWSQQRKTTQHPNPNATVVNTDMSMLVRFQEIVGMGTLYGRRRHNPKHQACWTWRVGGSRDVRALYEMLRPWLSERRRARAEEVLTASIRKPKWCAAR